MNESIDSAISQAKKRSASIYLVASAVTILILVAAFFWVFIIKGYVLIVKPDDAELTFTSERISGTVFRLGDKIYVMGSDASIVLKAATFAPVRVDITAATPANIEVIMPPLPATILAQTANDETNWYIDAILTHIGSRFEHSVLPGSYTLQAKNPYFQPWQSILNLARAEQKQVRVELQPIRGELRLSSFPEDARILIDDKPIPSSRFQVSGGQYLARIERAGYQPIVDTINVTADNPVQTRSYQMQPMQAELLISATPKDGTLLINQIEKPLGSIAVNANENVLVSYVKPGYFKYVESINLAPSEVRNLSIQLQKAQGVISITSLPEADIYINGKAVGKTPKTLTLPAIEHKLALIKPGYRSVQRTVTVEADEKSQFNFSLATEFEARRTEGRPLFAASLGIQLTRFSPTAFVMGSAPNEPGRRRNEYPVKVDFDRDVWVSAHEITEAQYARFTNSNATSKKPKTDVSWLDAVKFTNWLSQKEGLPPFYILRNDRLVGIEHASLGYRLPTEAEWEWLGKIAQRAVATTFVWGDSERIPRNVGNFADKSRQGKQLITLEDYDDSEVGVADVASYRPDRLGLYDLAGNVSEWMHDSYSETIPDLQATHINYLGVSAQGQHVTKGGNFTTGRLRDLRVAFREPAAEGSNTIGFRIARYAN